ncbi:MAG: DUF2314 domain-containing protein [Planctomycetota bacterium]
MQLTTDCSCSTWRRSQLLLLIPVVGFLSSLAPAAPGDQGAETDDSPYSFVFLLKENRKLDAAKLTKVVQRVFPRTDKSDPEGEVRGEAPRFMVQTPKARLLILNVDNPYVEDREKAAGKVYELRRREAIRTHEAWLSVDWYGDLPAGGEAEAYATIGKLAAALAGNDCLALFSPRENRLVPYSKGVVTKLRGKNPLDAFEDSEYPAVDGVDNEHPKLVAAQEEARRRVGELIEAFRKSGGKLECTVKAPFVEGDFTEQMWVTVTKIDSETIHGKLANEPVRIRKLELDDPVKLKLEEISDWMYFENGQMVGGFTVKAIAEIKKEKKSRKAEPKD